MFTSAVQAGNSYGYAGLGVMFLQTRDRTKHSTCNALIEKGS